jgi:hypothetical protein
MISPVNSEDSLMVSGSLESLHFPIRQDDGVIDPSADCVVVVDCLQAVSRRVNVKRNKSFFITLIIGQVKKKMRAKVKA